MEIKELNYKLILGYPEDYGVYLFLLEDGSVKEGYYNSFPYLNHQECIRVSDYESEFFYYEQIIG